ncbi:protease inhibitor HPI [Raphanus sativus]|uniref:Protease inhibitor HPI n=1 Tax=Raphanus sativus TaxID=3726 RepID=A0A6J0JHA8_RAPSA|nr:protease inhibitor HPI [Raphanus sativus]
MSSACAGKNSWPELLGTNGDFAASVIERENSRVDAMVILDGTPVTGDFRCDRVRVRVNRNRIVVQIPTTG